MHLHRTPAGRKAGDFCDENCRLAESYLSPSRSRVCDNSPHMSDTSNTSSVNSSHNSFTDNVNGRATLSKKYEESQCVESLDVNTSCISRPSRANIADDGNGSNLYGVNASHCSDLLSQVASEVFRSAPHFERPGSSNIHSAIDADTCPVGSTSLKHKMSEYSKDNIASTCPTEAASTAHDEPVKIPVQDEVNIKSEDLVELPNTCKPPSRSLSEDESDESDIIEHDVKVCDICGDAGREAELAICSRCSDGAEHIYCMRDMIKKLPGDDWLCEECKAEETKTKRQYVEAKPVKSPQISGKRHLQSTKVGQETKRQALESSSRTLVASNPIKVSQLSRESSLKSTERGKLKPSHQMSSCDHSRNGDVGMVRSPASFQQGLGPKGRLSKSHSFNMFNSKPRVKLVDEVPLKQKGTREHFVKDLRERPGNLLSKSLSFKSVNSSRPNATESKVKMLSPKLTHVQDRKCQDQVKEQTTVDRNIVEHHVGMTSSIVSPSRNEQKLIPHVESNHKELRAAQDGKLSTLSKTYSVAYKGECSAGALSTVGPRASVSEKKWNHFKGNDDSLLCFPSSFAEMSSISVDRNPQDGFLPIGETKILGDNIRDSSVISSTQAAPQICNVCQKCKEEGHSTHSTEFCTCDKAQENCSGVSSARSSEEVVHKGNKLKEAIHAALLRRPEICKKKVINQEPVELSAYNSDFDVEIAKQSLVPNGSKNNLSAEVILEGRVAAENLLSRSFESSATLDMKQLSVCTGDDKPLKPENSDLYDSSSTKPPVSNLSYQSSAIAQISLEMSTIPEYEYIWKGVFQVLRSGKPPELCGGMQAHLSCCASPKVFNVANKFPQRIRLNELPRMSVWPSQFHQTGAREDNIALYLFAKDIESYEKYYKNLLDRMMKNDLALKGNFEGFELLVFPSNQLPPKSQRWNMLFFLWGVFRGKRTNPLDSLEKSPVPDSNQPYPQMDVPFAATTPCEPHCLQKRTEEFIECDRTCNVVVASNASYLKKECLPDNGLDCNALPKAIGTAVFSKHEKIKVDSGTSDSSFSPKVGIHGNQEKVAAKYADVEKTVDRIDHGLQKLKERLKEENTHSGMDTYSVRTQISNEFQLRDIEDKKKMQMDLAETVPQASAPACAKKPFCEVNDEPGESVSKKLKTTYHAFYGWNSSKGRDSFSESFAACADELVSSSLVEDKLCDAACDEKIIHEDLGARERHFFPVDHSRNINDFHSGERNISWKGLTQNEKKCQDEVPNLELALGAELKVPCKGSLPFLVGVVDKKNQDMIPERMKDEQVEDGEPTSLSLSLPFPSDKEQTLKPVSKSEQLLPERHHVNSSLLLFGGLLDK